jgi:hypothetical protein
MEQRDLGGYRRSGLDPESRNIKLEMFEKL